jgi:hypothetical protein
MLVFCTRDYRLQSPLMFVELNPRQGQINLSRNLEMFQKKATSARKSGMDRKRLLLWVLAPQDATVSCMDKATRHTLVDPCAKAVLRSKTRI